MNYDWEDYKIRAMVERDHNPVEYWDTGTIPATIRIECTKDQQRWPCEAHRGLQAWKNADLRRLSTGAELEKLEESRDK